MRYIEVLPDGEVAQDRYLDESPVKELKDAPESADPVYTADGKRGFLYLKRDKSLLDLFDDLEHPLVLPKNLPGAEVWVLDRAKGTLLNVTGRDIDIYDAAGNRAYDRNGKPAALRIEAAGDNELKHILYRKGKLYCLFRTHDYVTRVDSVEVSVQKQATFTMAALNQTYAYRMAFATANNWNSSADIVGDQIHVYNNTIYDKDSWMETAVMELDPDTVP